jgi:hypothetical protein
MVLAIFMQIEEMVKVNTYVPLEIKIHLRKRGNLI